jgi:hypothetical protein
MIERVMYGDANKRRIDFVKERLVDITWGRRPDCDKFLDEKGVKRPVPEVTTGSGGHHEGGSPPAQLSERWHSHEPHLPTWAADAEQEPISGPSPGVSSADHSMQSVSSGSRDGRRHQEQAEQSVEGSPDEEQEAARKEWLQYHMRVGEWDKAMELVVSAEEREDLEYLMQREGREKRGGDSRRGRSGSGLASMSALEEAAAAVSGYAPVTRDPAAADEEDQML